MTRGRVMTLEQFIDKHPRLVHSEDFKAVVRFVGFDVERVLNIIDRDHGTSERIDNHFATVRTMLPWL